ncbi:hypothetical protein B0H34DRAFT_714440 [Crassisporium funariophilum]|nr:hypothetical protein B0H34DRAFT_714440 [Crassisporium funariophilum]
MTPPKQPCYCPNCKGAYMSRKTVNRHLALYPNASTSIPTFDEWLAAHGEVPVVRGSALEEREVDGGWPDGRGIDRGINPVVRRRLRAQLLRTRTPAPDILESKDDIQFSRIENDRLAQEFIAETSKPKLNTGKHHETPINRVRNPENSSVDISDPDTEFSLDLFLACDKAKEVYNGSRQAILTRYPETKVLSYTAVKKLIAVKISSV